MRKRKTDPIYYVMAGIIIVPVLIFVGYYIAHEIFNLALVDIQDKINSHFDVNISTEWELKFAERRGLWFDGGHYFVFEVDGENQEFFDDFSQERNDEFEKDVSAWLKSFSQRITKEFSFDLAKPYSWYKRDDYKVEYRFIYFIYQSNNLYVVACW